MLPPSESNANMVRVFSSDLGQRNNEAQIDKPNEIKDQDSSDEEDILNRKWTVIDGKNSIIPEQNESLISLSDPCLIESKIALIKQKNGELNSKIEIEEPQLEEQ